MFRAKSRPMRLPRIPTEITVVESRSYEEENNGKISTVVKLVKRNILDVEQEPPLPTSEEYTLENLLRAGVPLKDIPCGTLLDPTDLEDVSKFATARLISAIEADESYAEEVIETPSTTIVPNQSNQNSNLNPVENES